LEGRIENGILLSLVVRSAEAWLVVAIRRPPAKMGIIPDGMGREFAGDFGGFEVG